MIELQMRVSQGGIARAGRLTPQRKLSMGAAGPQGRERASREAIDSANGVIPCAETASPPPQQMER
jgi:hypothetical protein